METSTGSSTRDMRSCWYRSRQFILVTQGLTQCEFVYKGDNYKKKVREISNAWNQTHKMKRFGTNPMTTPEYDWW
ncbi:vimentin-like [Gossypium australe]|uniref:Vimentin-like n=1 Tax=Gossypium australe TaxID=47621 RepID=A0A5B6WRB4_9ROSI|nr:vimentin-like [Gossypium australe]